MDTPVYTVSVTVGGSSQTTESKIGNVLPQTIITRQSGSIVATFLDAAGAAFDLSSLTSLDMFAKPFNSSETPVNMGTGVISGAGSNIYTVVWVKDKIPAGWSTFAEDRDGAIVLYLQLEETGTLDFYQWGTRFNVDDGDYTGTADVLPLVSLVFYYNPIWGYNNTTVDADPGAGIFRMDNTALASVTELYIADDNQSSVDMQTLIQSSAVGTNIYITNPNVATDAALFTVSGAATNNTGYTTVPVTFVDSGSSSFTNSAILSFSFIPVSNEAPFIDSTALVKNAADATKLIGFDASAITTATERTITMPDANVDLTPGTGSFATAAEGDLAATAMQDLVDDTTPQLGGSLSANSKQIQESKGADIASATALPVLGDGNFFDVTGTTTITSFATTAIGTAITLQFDAILILTHHATDLILPSGANITTAAGDIASFTEYASGDYVCTSYTRASGESLIGGASGALIYLGTSGAISAAASVEFTTAAWFDGTYGELIFEFTELSPATDDVFLYITASIDGGSTYLAGTNYEYSTHGYSTTPAAVSSGSGGAAFIRVNPSSIGNVSDEFIAGKASLLKPTSTLEKRLTHQSTSKKGTGTASQQAGGGFISTLSPVDAVKFAFSSGNIASGEIKLYGVSAS